MFQNRKIYSNFAANYNQTTTRKTTMKYATKKPAIILLSDGTIFHGKSIGIAGTTFGEVCFNTGMTGYQEIFTDPSYFGQIMVTTNPHIGNYGVNENETESDKIMISGLVCKNFSFSISIIFWCRNCYTIVGCKLSIIFTCTTSRTATDNISSTNYPFLG